MCLAKYFSLWVNWFGLACSMQQFPSNLNNHIGLSSNTIQQSSTINNAPYLYYSFFHILIGHDILWKGITKREDRFEMRKASSSELMESKHVSLGILDWDNNHTWKGREVGVGGRRNMFIIHSDAYHLHFHSNLLCHHSSVSVLAMMLVLFVVAAC